VTIGHWVKTSLNQGFPVRCVAEFIKIQGGRSLRDGYQPMNMSPRFFTHTDEDNGGVHVNSGFQITHLPLRVIIALGSRAEKVYYQVITNYLTYFQVY
jgi:Zn-dependent metalloprotease